MKLCPNCQAPVRKDGYYLPPPQAASAALLESTSEILRRLADAAETYASSDPEMPSHRETEEEFERALAAARSIL